MATERYGDYEFYYPQLGLTVELPYEIDMGRGDPGEPFHDADRAVAIVYAHGAASEENELAIFDLARHRGNHVFPLDLGRYGVEQSPLLVQFVLERRYIEGPKAGMLEIQDQNFFGVVLAQPAVAEVSAGKRMLASGETTTVSVSRYGALVYDTPGVPPRLERDLPIHTRRFPPDTTPADVVWTVAREFKDPAPFGQGPELEHTWAAEDNFTPLTFRASLSDQPEPPGVRVIGCAVSLRLAFLDPENNRRQFPSQIPMAVVYDDGSRQTTRLEAGGRLLLELDRTKSAFTLAFDHDEPAYLASRAGDPDRSASRADVDALVADGWSVFGLPFGGTFRSMDWIAQGDAELDPQTRRFQALDDPERFFGTDVSPIELTLDPHWLFLRFEFGDRLHGLTHHKGARVGVPNLLLSGARSAPDGRSPAAWDTQAAWPVLADHMQASCQALPWIRARDEEGAPLAPLQSDLLICFQAEGYHVESTSPFDRRLVRLGADDPRLAPGVPRLALYDLPALWKSCNQFVRGPDVLASDLTPEQLTNASSADSPLVFCLDDLVLVDERGDPRIRDRAQDGDDRQLSKDSRITLLAFDPHDGFRFKVCRPRDDSRFFSDWSFERNVITDCPTEVRAVVFCGEVYPIANRRTQEGSGLDLTRGHVLGARAALRGDPAVTLKCSVRGAGDHSRHEAAAFDMHYLHAVAMHHDHETVVSGLLVLSSLVVFPDLDRGGRPRDVERWVRGGVDRIVARWNAADVRYEPSGDLPLMIRQLTLVEAVAADEGFDPEAEKRRHLVATSLVSDDHEVACEPGKLVLRRGDCDGKDRQRGRSWPAAPSAGGALLAGAHALGHVFGLSEEHLACVPGWGLPRYQQPHDGMPYQADSLTVMGADRLVRLRHHSAPGRWLNGGALERFLPGAHVHVSAGPHELDASADPWAPLHQAAAVALGSQRCDLFLYQVDAEFASELGAPGVLVVRTFVEVAYSDDPRPWQDRWRREWATALHADLRRELDGRFALEASSATAHMGRVHVVFEPRYHVGPEEPTQAAHVEVAVALEGHSIQVEAGVVRCGANSDTGAVARSLYGKLPSAGAFGLADLAPLAQWVSDVTGAPFTAHEVAP